MTQALRTAGTTPHGHFRLRAPSRTAPGMVHHVLVSRDGKRVSCDCQACAFHRLADGMGRLTVKVADVRAKRVSGLCWHIKRSARLAPLLAGGYVGKGGRA